MAFVCGVCVGCVCVVSVWVCLCVVFVCSFVCVLCVFVCEVVLCKVCVSGCG